MCLRPCAAPRHVVNNLRLCPECTAAWRITLVVSATRLSQVWGFFEKIHVDTNAHVRTSLSPRVLVCVCVCLCIEYVFCVKQFLMEFSDWSTRMNGSRAPEACTAYWKCVCSLCYRQRIASQKPAYTIRVRAICEMVRVQNFARTQTHDTPKNTRLRCIRFVRYRVAARVRGATPL